MTHGKYMVGAALGLVLAVGSGVASATLITNGTFDTDLSGWSTVGSTTGVTWDAGTAHVGRPGTPGVAIFSQKFDIPVGTPKLLVEFDYEWQNVRPTQKDTFLAELIYESTGGTVTETLLTEGSDTGAFLSTVSFSDILVLANLASSPPMNGEIRFTLEEVNSPVGTRIKLDNVDVRSVPEPTTLLLLGLGLAGLGVAKRRLH